jgi:hypothetical protein
MKRIIIGFIIVTILIFSSCQSNSSSDSSDNNETTSIELLGTWHMTNWNYDVTFTNTSITFDSGYTGTIQSFDNTKNELIMLWTSHPAFTGKFQKWKWINDPINGLYVYNEQDTQINAINDTAVKYIDTITKK